MDGLRKDIKWLGITEQQYKILDSILIICKRNEVASPKAIIEEISSWHDTPKIQRSNFFNQLKKLQGKSYVRKLTNASYELNFDGIREALEEMRIKVALDSKNLESAIEETESHFNSLMSREKVLEADFHEYDEMLEKVANMVKTSKLCYITGIFPKILYSHSPVLMYNKGGRHYANKLWERCIHDKEMTIVYVTHLDVEYLFKRMMSKYNNPIQAYDECRSILNNMEGLLKEHENLKIHYIQTPYGLDIVIPDAEKLSEFFLLVRDQNHHGIGSVYINSSALAVKFKKLFDKELESTIDLSGPKGKAEIRKLKKRLDIVYKESKS